MSKPTSLIVLPPILIVSPSRISTTAGSIGLASVWMSGSTPARSEAGQEDECVAALGDHSCLLQAGIALCRFQVVRIVSPSAGCFVSIYPVIMPFDGEIECRLVCARLIDKPVKSRDYRIEAIYGDLAVAVHGSLQAVEFSLVQINPPKFVYQSLAPRIDSSAILVKSVCPP
jgi:hypothetical protein